MIAGIEYLKQAREYLESEQYLKSAQHFSKAFGFLTKVNNTDRYNAACGWALAGYPDSAFEQLFIVANNAPLKGADAMMASNILHLTNDDDLKALRADKRWPKVCSLVVDNKMRIIKELKWNAYLVNVLDTVHFSDQYYRQELRKAQKKYGYESKEAKAVIKIIGANDTANLRKVLRILDDYGWPGREVIGDVGSETIFLVIQHADYKTQREYLPIMRKAVARKKARPQWLAMLEDRVALSSGKKQIYGSQVGRYESGEHYIRPLEDPDNVDKRRADVGLLSLAQYGVFYKITWNPEEYKKQLPEIEKYEADMKAKK